MYAFLWVFFIYAFLGWCTEVSFAALKTGRFVNRGFLNGPVCPIYVLRFLEPLKGSFPLLFLDSVVLTSALEWLTGFVLEKLFHQRWWDYSDEPFNLGGYICLRFSIAWGFACLFVVDILHPTVAFFIRVMPHTLGLVLLWAFGAAMAVDLAATVRTVTRMNRTLSQIDELAAKIRANSNEFGEGLADRVLDAAEKGADLREDLDSWMEELSQRLGVSKSHLVRTFTAAVGVSPGRYLTTVRIEAAMRLLLHREYTLDVIASLCGFSGANYLCRVFKKETGKSPAQWRALAGHSMRPLTPEENRREQELFI